MFKLPKKKIIGITGTMGSGKSQVGKILSEQYSVLDCDKVNAELLLPNRKGFEELKERKLIKIDEDGYLDKKQLSFDMFQDKMIKKEVENILHPLIFQEMNAWIENQKDGLLFYRIDPDTEEKMLALTDRGLDLSNYCMAQFLLKT